MSDSAELPPQPGSIGGVNYSPNLKGNRWTVGTPSGLLNLSRKEVRAMQSAGRPKVLPEDERARGPTRSTMLTAVEIEQLKYPDEKPWWEVKKEEEMRQRAKEMRPKTSRLQRLRNWLLGY